METKDFVFELPEDLIAQDPLEKRSDSRLLVMDRISGEIFHRHFYDIIDFLMPGDCLVLNDTKVIPARLLGIKEITGAHVELLLLRRETEDVWECLARPGRKLREGAVVSFGNGLLRGEIIGCLPDGNRRVRFSWKGIFEEVLDRLGEMPLPPYIKKKLSDKGRYNTVYARNDGSAAAPTAGLHWTKELLSKAREKGVEIAYVTLHVGLGTFRPVKAANIEDHHMHSEYYSVSLQEAEKMNSCRANGGRLIAVGTTSCRTLESCAFPDGRIPESSGFTDIFIYPGYRFKAIDGLITNFHLPGSTLLMLVSAFAGREHIMKAYKEAVRLRYRFFSFGDAMFITDTNLSAEQGTR